MDTLTIRDVEILTHLVKNELRGFCGDQGYSELSQLLKKLEHQQKRLVDKESKD
ncbi:hypothetical protein [Photobacterium leiognathi]|uniref:hypothetical protein n=1 Tax=Photobacterium leiognathi TaxID=553611 RepID=UPI0027387EA8|nr:hypothetical protein [Photobacterium leiognathi]